jgi:hypothetical protein
MADTATDLGRQAQEQTQKAASRATDQVRAQVDQRSTEAGQRVKSTADDIRTVGQQLREQGKDGPARLADKAAERAERMGGWLEESDADRILRDIEDFGRRQPWALALGGLALGFAASRFLKASSSQRYESQRLQTTAVPDNGHGMGAGVAFQPGTHRTGAQPVTRGAPPATTGAPPATTGAEPGPKRRTGAVSPPAGEER